MIKHVCKCGYIYNSAYGDIDGDVEPGVKFEDLPMGWVCPFCGLGKEAFTDQNKKSVPHIKF